MLNNIRIIPPNLNEKCRYVDFIADFTRSICASPETRHTSIRFALSLVLCRYGLNELNLVGFHYQAFPKIRQTVVGGIWFPRLVFRKDFLGLCKIFTNTLNRYF